jgi:hypothetical protein
MRGCVRAISSHQCDELIAREGAIALVCGDDMDALKRAHALKIPTVKFRPDRGALEYALTSIDAAEYSRTMDQLVSQAESVLFAKIQGL